DGIAMVAAAKKTGRIVQIGSQRVSSVICAKAKELIASGAIGDLNLVEGVLGRNDPTGCWEYPPPPDLALSNFDWDTWQGDTPKRPWDPETSPKYFARWRCWKEYGTGVAGDSGAIFLPATPAREILGRCFRIPGPLRRVALPRVPVEIAQREIGRGRILPAARGI